MTSRDLKTIPSVKDRPFGLGYRQSWAVVIGINYHDNPHIVELVNAENDARKVSRLLKEVYDFGKIIELIGDDATHDNIVTELLQTLVEDVDREDRVLIFYAGHGLRIGNDGYLIPHDDNGTITRRIPMDYLQKAWINTPAKHVLCILDCCYSGLLMEGTRGDITEPDLEDWLTQFYGRQIIMAGGSSDTIADVFRESDGTPSRHSYLTKHLVDVLNNDIPGKEKITAETLYLHLQEQVFAEANRQQLIRFAYGSNEPGRFLLAKPQIRLPGTIREGLDPKTKSSEQVLRAIDDFLWQLAKLDQRSEAMRTGASDGEQFRTEAAPMLTKLLREYTDPQVIQEAGRALGKVLLGSPKLQSDAQKDLFILLCSDDGERVEQASNILAALASDWPDSPAVLYATGQEQRDQVQRALEAALLQREPSLVESALKALVLLFPTDVVLPWLRVVLMDAQSSDSVRIFALTTLAALGSSIDIRLMKQALERRPLDSDYRVHATKSLIDLVARLGKQTLRGDTGALTAARKLMDEIARQNDQPALRSRALEMAVALSDQEWSKTLLRVAVDPNPKIREQALLKLSERFSPKKIDTAIDAVIDAVVDAVVDASEPINSKQIDIVIDAMGAIFENEPDAYLRTVCCDMLGALWRRCIDESGGPAQFWRKREEIRIWQEQNSSQRGPHPWKEVFPLKRMETLNYILSGALDDRNLSVRNSAASAMAWSGDRLAADAILDHIHSGLELKRSIDPVLKSASQQSSLQRLRALLPPQEFVEAALLLLARIGDDDRLLQQVLQKPRDPHMMLEAARKLEYAPYTKSENWLRPLVEGCTTDDAEANILDKQYLRSLQMLMLEAVQAQKSPDKTFLPLIEHCLSWTPGEGIDADQQPSIELQLHLLAIGALSKQFQIHAIGPAIALMKRALSSELPQSPTLKALTECLEQIGGSDAITALLDLLEAPSLQAGSLDALRLRAAEAVQHMVRMRTIDTELQERLNRLASTDPSEDVRRMLKPA
jgi:hypothetical protein